MVKIPEHILKAYREAIRDYGKQFKSKFTAETILAHAEEYLSGMPEPVKKEPS
jgi:hypothetical protein